MTEEARSEYAMLHTGNEEKQRRSAELDSEIADKEEKVRQADRENTNSIMSSLANLLGKGKYAEIERENARLHSEVETANADRNKAFVRVEEMERQVAQIPVLAEQHAITIIEKNDAQHEVEVRKLRKQHNDHILSLRSEYDRLSKVYRNLDSSLNSTFKRLEREKFDLIARIKAMLDMLNEALREAVRVVVEFSRSALKEFSMRYREAVVDYLSTTPDVRGAANSVKVFARPFLDDRQFDKGSKEVDRLTSNFLSVQEEVNRTQNRGFKL